MEVRGSIARGDAVVDIPYSRWYAAIPRRRSRRRLDGTELEPDVVAQLRDVCGEFRPFPEARAELVTESTDRVFRGAVGPYGKVKGAPAFIAFVGDMRDHHIQEKVGYLGEGIILEATAMDLATCWVGGFFRPKLAASVVGIGEGERVLAVTPVGHAPDKFSREERAMTGFGLTHRRKPLSGLVTGIQESEWPTWAKRALEAARVAPSAVNRQPWRFHVQADSLTVSVDNPLLDLVISKRLDCGIAMLHIEVAALDCGVRGKWELLRSPQVARFTVDSRV